MSQSASDDRARAPHELRAPDTAAGLAEFAAAVAAPTPAPGGGSVAAWTGALAAALAQMVAGLTAGRPRYASVDAETREALQRAAALGLRLADLAAQDEAAYAALAAASKPAKPPDTTVAARAAAVQERLLRATEVPLGTSRAAAEVARLAAWLAEHGNANASADAAMAAFLAAAACRGSACNVRVNAASLTDRPNADAMVREAAALARAAAADADLAERGAVGRER